MYTHHNHHASTPSSSGAASSADLSHSSSGVISPTTLSKLPGLKFAISHRRNELRLPSLVHNTTNNSSSSSAVYDRTENGENMAMNANHLHHHPYHRHNQGNALYLSMPQCETPHYVAGAPLCPETSPIMDKKTTNLSRESDASPDKKRKKGTRRGTLNAEAKNVLKAWMFSPEHFAHPYPSEEEKEELALEAGIEVKQLSNWFTNARKRLWQPVLRQSGVEVKNFLSTGRGGPRGNKLDVPANLQHLIAQKENDHEEDEDDEEEEEQEEEEAETDECCHSPSPLSPAREELLAPKATSGLNGLKRSWNEMHSSPAPSSMPANANVVAVVAPKKKTKTVQRNKRAKESHKKDHHAASSLTTTASQLSQELRLALANHHHHVPEQQSSTTMHLSNSMATSFKEIEILAAASLIGLHHQQFQPVH